MDLKIQTWLGGEGDPTRHAFEHLANNKAKRKHQLSPVEETQSSGSEGTIQPRGQLSHLERLPSELVHRIFFHCLEVNMARATTVIARILSNEAIYNLLILTAFFYDDGIPLLECNTYPESSIQERIRFQESILSCRWCSLKRIEACMSENNSTLEDYHPEEKHIGVVDQTYYNAWNRPRNVSPSKDSSIINQADHVRTSHCRRYPCRLVPRHIPNKLLTGNPWTPEKLAFLKQLRQGFRRHTCVYVLHVSPQALFQGMEEAINERNPTALLVLLEVHDAAFHINRKKQSNDINSLKWRNMNQTKRLKEINGLKGLSHHPYSRPYTTPNTYPLPLSLFHLTTKHAYKDAEPLLSLLIRGGLDSIPKDDPTMTKWALSTAADDASLDSLAAFLLSYMKGGFVEIESSRMFWHGRLVAELQQRYHCNSQASFAEELGYEMPRA